MWNLRVNTKKTKIMIFENGRHTTYNFIYGNVVLDIVTSFECLGMYVFTNGIVLNKNLLNILIQ